MLWCSARMASWRGVLPASFWKLSSLMLEVTWCLSTLFYRLAAWVAAYLSTKMLGWKQHEWVQTSNSPVQQPKQLSHRTSRRPVIDFSCTFKINNGDCSLKFYNEIVLVICEIFAELVRQSRIGNLYTKENWYLQRTQRTCRLTSQSRHWVRICTAVSFSSCTAECNGVLLLFPCWTFGSQPLSSNSFSASPLSSLNDHKDKSTTKHRAFLHFTLT